MGIYYLQNTYNIPYENPILLFILFIYFVIISSLFNRIGEMIIIIFKMLKISS